MNKRGRTWCGIDFIKLSFFPIHHWCRCRWLGWRRYGTDTNTASGGMVNGRKHGIIYRHLKIDRHTATVACILQLRPTDINGNDHHRQQQ